MTMLFVITGALLFLILAMRDFRLALGVFAFLLPSYLIRFSLGPLPSTFLEVLFGLVVLGWLGSKQYSFKKVKKSLRESVQTPFFWPGLILIGAATISVFFSTEFTAGLGILKAYFIEPFLLYLILVDSLKKQSDWTPIFMGLGGAVIVLTVIAVIQFVTGWWSPTWDWAQPGMQRSTGLFTSPNALGLFVGPVSMLYIGWFYLTSKCLPVSSKQKFNELMLFQGVVIFCGLLSIWLAVSRGAMIGMAVGIFAFLWWSWKKRLVADLAIIAVILALLIAPIRAGLVDLVTFNVDSGHTRIALYQGAVALLKQEPVLGLGLASFADRYELIRIETVSERLIYPHNVFLNFWTETGLIGLLAVIWILVILFRHGWRNEGVQMHSLFLLALIPIFIHGLVDVPYFKNDLAMLTWILLAGVSACNLHPAKMGARKVICK
jgi:hypothetical protein